MSPRQSVRLLRRVRLTADQGGGTLHFMVMGLGRPDFLAKEDVPEFEGDEAWFVLERVRGKVWMTWKVLRQVSAPEMAQREIAGW